MNYPSYYRNQGRIVKVVSDTETRTIILPPDSTISERFTTRYPNANLLQQDLKNMLESDERKWKEFIFTFYQNIEAERKLANEKR